MNASEKVVVLEALLGRIQRNAQARPKPGMLRLQMAESAKEDPLATTPSGLFGKLPLAELTKAESTGLARAASSEDESDEEAPTAVYDAKSMRIDSVAPRSASKPASAPAPKKASEARVVTSPPAAPSVVPAAPQRGMGWFAAAVVVGLVGTFWLMRKDNPDNAAAPAPKQETHSPSPSKVSTLKTDDKKVVVVEEKNVEVAAPTPTAPPSAASAAPATSASASPSNALKADAAPPPSETVSLEEAAKLPSNQGYLIVTAAESQSVYARGKMVGVTNQKIQVPCGVLFIRLGRTASFDSKQTEWLSEGKTVGIACQNVTKASLP